MPTQDKINTAIEALNPTSPYYEMGRLAFNIGVLQSELTFSDDEQREAFEQGFADAREEEYETRLPGTPAPQ